MVSVIRKASGRSGSAIRAMNTAPKLVATIAPASAPTRSSNQRRPAAKASSTRPRPASADPARAGHSRTPKTWYAAAVTQ